jgi:hypothetical protein
MARGAVLTVGCRDGHLPEGRHGRVQGLESGGVDAVVVGEQDTHGRDYSSQEAGKHRIPGHKKRGPTDGAP